MTDLVRFETDDGTSVLIETGQADPERQHDDLVRQYGGGSDGGDESDGGPLGRRLAGAAAAAATIANTMRDRLSPDELTIELGLKVSGEANWFVARSQTEGTVKVTAKWRPGGPGETRSP